MAESHIVPADLLQRIASYLAERPFKEVVHLIADLQAQAKKHEPPASEPAESANGD